MDDSRQTAFNAAAPQDERQSAMRHLQEVYQPLESALLPQDAVRNVIDFIQDQYAEGNALRKAQVIDFPGYRRKQRGEHGPQSVWLDKLQIFAHGEYFEKPSPLGFEALRSMVEQTPILNAIVLTRIRQVQRFCNPQEDDGPGFVIRHVDRDHQLTKGEEESIRLLQRFVLNCGWEFNPRARRKMRRDNFSQFVSKAVRDTLSMDSAAIETEFKRDKGRGIDGFYALDGATIRLCDDEGYHGDDRLFAVQVLQGRIVTAYSHDDLIYEARNPRTDVRLAGYGMAETELLVRVVTGFLNALTYNIKGFDENSIPRGLLHLSGNYGTDDISAFKRYWNSSVRGINNAWSMPVLVSKDQESKASFENFGIEFNEMYFAKWMTFLTSIACAIYGMSPAEINFDSFTGGSTSALSGSDTAEKLAASQDKGLLPLMSWLESVMSDFIIADFGDKYVFRWAGLEEEDQEKRHEIKKLVLSVNEVRAQEGYNATKEDWGDAPLNPSLIGVWQQAQQAAQEDYGHAPEEGGGMPPGNPPPDAQADEEAPDGEGPDKEALPGDFGAQQGRAGDFGKALRIWGIE